MGATVRSSPQSQPEIPVPQHEPSSQRESERAAPVYSASDPTTDDMPSRRALQVSAVMIVAAALLVVIAGLITRFEEDAAQRDWTDAQAVPTVSVVSPVEASSAGTLNLPGRLEAWYRAPLYARVSGYLASWSHDIGSAVKSGELLARIEAPDLDHQLAQAVADLDAAQANLALSRSTAQRWQSMLGTNAVAKQEVDEKTGDLAAKQALVKSARANVDRLRAEQGFTRIVAPFDGIVTARQTDVGQLIQAGAVGGPELFEVADVHRLRVYVSVPQNFVPQVPPGTIARITVPDRPGETYSGTVDSSAQSVAPESGTTLMQIVVDNPARELMPGGFAQVSLDLLRQQGRLSIPANALIFDARGMSVATVDAASHVHLHQISVARDMGATLDIAEGITAEDRVIENPPDGLSEGATVRIAGTPRPPEAEGPRGKDGNERG